MKREAARRWRGAFNDQSGHQAGGVGGCGRIHCCRPKQGGGQSKQRKGGGRGGSVAGHSLYRRNTFLSPPIKLGLCFERGFPQSGNKEGLEIWALGSSTRCTCGFHLDALL